MRQATRTTARQRTARCPSLLHTRLRPCGRSAGRMTGSHPEVPSSLLGPLARTAGRQKNEASYAVLDTRTRSSVQLSLTSASFLQEGSTLVSRNRLDAPTPDSGPFFLPSLPLRSGSLAHSARPGVGFRAHSTQRCESLEGDHGKTSIYPELERENAKRSTGFSLATTELTLVSFHTKSPAESCLFHG